MEIVRGEKGECKKGALEGQVVWRGKKGR